MSLCLCGLVPLAVCHYAEANYISGLRLLTVRAHPVCRDILAKGKPSDHVADVCEGVAGGNPTTRRKKTQPGIVELFRNMKRDGPRRNGYEN